MKIGIIIGTNRQNSISEKIACYYSKQLEKKNIDHQSLFLKDLPSDLAFSVYKKEPNPAFEAIQKSFDSFDKIIFIIPEYNSSFPGILKTFVDALRHPDSLEGKKVALVGVSSGAYGNAVGLSHFSDVLAYLNADVLGLRLKLANILKHFQENKFTLDVYAKFVEKQINALIDF